MWSSRMNETYYGVSVHALRTGIRPTEDLRAIPAHRLFISCFISPAGSTRQSLVKWIGPQWPSAKVLHPARLQLQFEQHREAFPSATTRATPIRASLEPCRSQMLSSPRSWGPSTLSALVLSRSCRLPRQGPLSCILGEATTLHRNEAAIGLLSEDCTWACLVEMARHSNRNTRLGELSGDARSARRLTSGPLDSTMATSTRMKMHATS